jgi:hypothetical protein
MSDEISDELNKLKILPLCILETIMLITQFSATRASLLLLLLFRTGSYFWIMNIVNINFRVDSKDSDDGV